MRISTILLTGVTVTALITVPGCSSADEGCSDDYPNRLTVSSADPGEQPYLNEVTACTDGDETAVWLRNTGENVWKPGTSASFGATVDYTDSPDAANGFRDLMAATYSHALLTPDTAVVVHSSPAETSWDLDVPSSIAWQTREQLNDLLESAGTGLAADALANRGPYGRAFVYCTAAVASTAQNYQSLGSGQASEVALAGLGIVGSASRCGTEWVEAERAAGVAGTSYEDVRALQSSTEFIEALDRRFTGVTALGRTIRLLLHR